MLNINESDDNTSKHLKIHKTISKRALLQKQLASIHLDTKTGFSLGAARSHSDAPNLFIAAGEKHKPQLNRKEQRSS